jgi:hypothetical protein
MWTPWNWLLCRKRGHRVLAERRDDKFVYARCKDCGKVVKYPRVPVQHEVEEAKDVVVHVRDGTWTSGVGEAPTSWPSHCTKEQIDFFSSPWPDTPCPYPSGWGYWSQEKGWHEELPQATEAVSDGLLLALEKEAEAMGRNDAVAISKKGGDVQSPFCSDC